MGPSFLKKHVAWASGAVLIAAATSAQAAVIYANDVDGGLTFNPGNTKIIAYDDVTFLNPLTADVAISRITLGIFKPATSVPFTLDVYAFAVDDSGTPLSTPVPLTASPLTIAASPDEGVQLVSVGDGVTTLISVPLNAHLLGSGNLYGTIGVGLRLNTTNGAIGWSFATGAPDNLDRIGRFNLANPSAASNALTLSFDASPFAAFHAVVEGSVVPEPATCACFRRPAC